MGMYDEVRFQCPNCRVFNTVQSKAGPCKLKSYALERAPLAVVADLEGDGKRGQLRCDHCGVRLEIFVQTLVSVRTKLDEEEG